MSNFLSDEIAGFKASIMEEGQEELLFDLEGIAFLQTLLAEWRNSVVALENEVSRLTWNLEAQRTENRILETAIRNPAGSELDRLSETTLDEIERPGSNVVLITRQLSHVGVDLGTDPEGGAA